MRTNLRVDWGPLGSSTLDERGQVVAPRGSLQDGAPLAPLFQASLLLPPLCSLSAFSTWWPYPALSPGSPRLPEPACPRPQREEGMASPIVRRAWPLLSQPAATQHRPPPSLGVGNRRGPCCWESVGEICSCVCSGRESGSVDRPLPPRSGQLPEAFAPRTRSRLRCARDLGGSRKRLGGWGC